MLPTTPRSALRSMYTSTGVPFSSRATRISDGVLLMTRESPMAARIVEPGRFGKHLPLCAGRPDDVYRRHVSTGTQNGWLRIIPLGGLGHIGGNMMLYETADDMVMLDCGVLFPNAE